VKNALALTLALLFSPAATTQQISSTGYAVNFGSGERITLPNGKVVLVGMRSHASLVNDETGELSSQWCTANGYPDASGELTAIAGFCSVTADNGDELWLSFVGGAEDQPSSWTVMGGTGQYAGATGSGTSRNASNRGDGYAWAMKSTGTLTTK
jgi:hypothetical protein